VRKIGLAIINMGVQRLLDLISIVIVTTVVVRSLSRDEYGVLSVVLSYGMFFNILNISISSILIRDYIKIKNEINQYMNAFVVFSALKSLGILATSAVIGIVLYVRYESTAMLLVLGLSCLTLMVLFLAEPFVVLLSVDFRQYELTKIALISSVLNIALSFADGDLRLGQEYDCRSCRYGFINHLCGPGVRSPARIQRREPYADYS
jgi:O-antigen/teichoic acid export membrane protein